MLCKNYCTLMIPLDGIVHESDVNNTTVHNNYCIIEFKTNMATDWQGLLTKIVLQSHM